VIGSLRGRLASKSPQELLVDVGGVGYRVHVPLSTFYGVGDPGAEVSLLIHTHVRDDALLLFGFLTSQEEMLFQRLIGVSGVGPKLAINILSGIEVGELASALRTGDVMRLTRIPGVGKKTAERLVLELKDAMQRLSPAEPRPPEGDGRQADLLTALVHLGYSRAEVEPVVLRLVRERPGDRLEDLLRRSLQLLSAR
jgi:Holliday junction DNA helicase RuvA